MKISQELQNLERLHWNGTLTEQEFAQAKAVVLGTQQPTPTPAPTTPTLTCTLAELEQAWAAERRQYRLLNLSDQKVEPTPATAQEILVQSRAIGGGLLLFALLLAVVLTDRIVLVVVPLAGLAGIGFFVAGLQLAKQHADNAEKLRQGWAVYEERRARLLRQHG